MLHLSGFFQKYAGDEAGATAIEYCLIAAGVALAIAVIVFALGVDVQSIYTDLVAAFRRA